jgi:hypothetical protein
MTVSCRSVLEAIPEKDMKNDLEFPFRFGGQTLPFWPPIPRNPDGPYPSAIPEKM